MQVEKHCRKNTRNREGADRLEKHWEQGQANDGDTRQVWRERRLGRHTGSRKENRTLGTGQKL